MKILHPISSRRVRTAGSLAVAALLAAGVVLPGFALAADSAAGNNNEANAACAALEAPLGESMTGLSIDGLKVESAKPQQFGSTAGCRVTASLALTGGAAPLRFALDLPAQWNTRGAQLAGGIDRAPQPAFDPARAVAEGFAVFGALRAQTGAGPQASGGGGNDDTALEAQKRVRDAAAELLARRFNRFPDRFYLIADANDAEQALALAARHPRAWRGMLVDASGAGGAGGGDAGASQATPPNPTDHSTAIAPYIANGGKLLILAPADPSVAGSLAIVRFERDQVAKKGARYASDAVRLYSLPDAVAAAAVNWLPVLVDWAENLKAPAVAATGQSDKR